ncbi:MAG TPA: hypothetical protein VFV20_01955, partial [Candidatus Limnocylindria bacterium]|nr:hypothetical protein [Candidatus Limnocylindria bacterium]
MIELWAGHGGTGDPRATRRSLRIGDLGERASGRVLVIDDDPSILDTVSAILSGEGYQVMSAPGG